MNTYRKLKDGTWGVSVQIALATIAGKIPQSGDQVEVTLKNGTTKKETLGEAVGSSDGAVAYRIVPRAQEPRPEAQVGSLSGVMALFDKARAHLKRPAITLRSEGENIRLAIAGPQAKVPGSINVTNRTKTSADGLPLWYGRIHKDGRFEQRGAAPQPMIDLLRAFAADPAKVAGEHGRLTGRCCFCDRPLQDERSTAVGYGPQCAEHYDLPWGERPAAFGEAA